MSYLNPVQIGIVQGLLLSWSVLGFALAYRILGFPDLTVEASVPLGGGIFALLARAGWPIWSSIPMALFGGLVAGTLTALVHLRFRVNKFLAGIIVVAIFYSLDLRIMSGPNLSLLGLNSLLDAIAAYLGPNSGWAMVGLLSMLCVVGMSLLSALMSSRTGAKIRAAGSNGAFAESIGLRPIVAIVAGLAVCNALAAFSGVLIADYQGFADVSSGQGVLVLALASMAIGEAIIPQRRLVYHRYVIFSAVLGSLIYQILVAEAVHLGLATTDLRLATGTLVLIVVIVRTARDLSSREALALQ